MHAFEVGRVLFDDLLEVGPLLEHYPVLTASGAMVLFNEFVELTVKQLYLFLRALIDLRTPVHSVSKLI